MTYLQCGKLLPGPFGLNLPAYLQYGKLLPHFLSTEEKHEYQRNKKKLGVEWDYSKKEITYKLNSNFYRAPEWDTVNWKESVVILGCSHVFGEGLANNETVVCQLENLLDRPVINLGQSGTSTIFSWHNSLRLFETFGVPYAVIQLWTDYSRLPFYDTDEVKRVGFWSGGKWDNFDSDMKTLYEIWNKNDTHAKTFFKCEATASKEFWSSKTRYYQGSFFEDTATLLGIDFFEKIDSARDLIHHGAETHKLAAKKIFDSLQNLI